MERRHFVAWGPRLFAQWGNRERASKEEFVSINQVKVPTEESPEKVGLRNVGCSREATCPGGYAD